MIAFLSGVLVARTPNAALIDVQGVGYEVFMSQTSLSKLPAPGEPVRVLTHFHLREDAALLFGFMDAEEKELFERLIGVSGVGPKVALAALSSFAPRKLVEAVSNQDVALISKIPGIGKKTASRIILELKGSFDQLGDTLFSPQGSVSEGAVSQNGAAEALLSMGFTSAEAELALKGAPENASESVLIQYALKRLGSNL